MARQEVEDRPARPSERTGRRPIAWVGTVPFFAYVGVFLLLPTGIVVWGGISNGHGLDLANLKVLGDAPVRTAFWHSVELCSITAIVGAVCGSVLAYVVATGNPDGLIRRTFLSGSGVLAQFGGVTLAFAFTAAIGPTSGFLFHAPWFYKFPVGIGLIYIYFQIPLMLLVFFPAVLGLRKEWREATESLGGSTWDYWRLVGGRLLLPAFLGATLLLFANALSAYATIQAWENQIPYVVPQLISNSITSEVGLASANAAQALALGMVVLVAVVMTSYVFLQRKTSRWLR
jgi:putative spermidine/putrescine transport system permease protein